MRSAERRSPNRSPSAVSNDFTSVGELRWVDMALESLLRCFVTVQAPWPAMLSWPANAPGAEHRTVTYLCEMPHPVLSCKHVFQKNSSGRPLTSDHVCDKSRWSGRLLTSKVEGRNRPRNNSISDGSLNWRSKTLCPPITSKRLRAPFCLRPRRGRNGYVLDNPSDHDAFQKLPRHVRNLLLEPLIRAV